MRTELTREGYQKKWKYLMETFNYVYQDGEEIVQCRDPYPPYWFVSNKGYVMSVYGSGIKLLSPGIRRTGHKNKNGERPGRDWYYVYVMNHKRTTISVHKVIADHFCLNEFTGDYSGDTHHIRKKNSFADNEWKECNEAANMQNLPEEYHEELTAYAKKPAEQIEAEMDQQEFDETIELSSDQAIALINILLQQGNEGRVYLVRDSDQAAAAYPVGGIVNHVDAEGKVTQRFITPKELARLDGEQKKEDLEETEAEEEQQEEKKEA